MEINDSTIDFLPKRIVMVTRTKCYKQNTTKSTPAKNDQWFLYA